MLKGAISVENRSDRAPKYAANQHEGACPQLRWRCLFCIAR